MWIHYAEDGTTTQSKQLEQPDSPPFKCRLPPLTDKVMDVCMIMRIMGTCSFQAIKVNTSISLF